MTGQKTSGSKDIRLEASNCFHYLINTYQYLSILKTILRVNISVTSYFIDKNNPSDLTEDK